LLHFGEETYTTKVGETQVVPLADGSIITLNTNSKVAVRYSSERREIRLERGEVLFDVAKNKKRPFIVLAGDTQVRAVGTSFTVKLLPEQPVQVLVQEGVVEVKRPEIPEASPVRVAANTRVVALRAAPIVIEEVPQAQVARDLAWKVGRIAFDNQTLKAAAQEFSRYSPTEIQIDPSVADETITGLFVSNDPVGFARGAAMTLNLHVSLSDNQIRLSR
jgi:transmembrane sensor